MKYHNIRIITAMLGATMLFVACGKDKDNVNLIIGAWSNTAQSYEITIAGQESIPAGTICMEFTADSVMISDMRCNCLPKWEHYTLAKEDGKQILYVGNNVHEGYVVEELTSNKLVLTPKIENIDMSFMYTMERYTAPVHSN